MRIENIALLMDASCIDVLSMSRMGCVQQLDLGSSLDEVLTSKLTSGQYVTLLSPIEVLTSKLTSGHRSVLSL